MTPVGAARTGAGPLDRHAVDPDSHHQMGQGLRDVHGDAEGGVAAVNKCTSWGGSERCSAARDGVGAERCLGRHDATNEALPPRRTTSTCGRAARGLPHRMAYAGARRSARHVGARTRNTHVAPPRRQDGAVSWTGRPSSRAASTVSSAMPGNAIDITDPRATSGRDRCPPDGAGRAAAAARKTRPGSSATRAWADREGCWSVASASGTSRQCAFDGSADSVKPTSMPDRSRCSAIGTRSRAQEDRAPPGMPPRAPETLRWVRGFGGNRKVYRNRSRCSRSGPGAGRRPPGDAPLEPPRRFVGSAARRNLQVYRTGVAVQRWGPQPVPAAAVRNAPPRRTNGGDEARCLGERVRPTPRTTGS